MRRLLLIALLAACSKKPPAADRCQQVIEKSMTVLNEMSALRGAKLGAPEKQKLVEDCRKQTRSGKPDPQMDCVLAAKDDKDVRACYIKGYDEYLKRSKETEAKVQLSKLGKNAKLAYVTNAEFPKGKVGPTPASPCCAEQIKQCLPTDTMWSDPVWQALEFGLDGPFGFQYAYESDGKTFTATATGDVTCQGTPTTLTITGKVNAQGEPEITKP
jgi:hypothetical protein